MQKGIVVSLLILALTLAASAKKHTNTEDFNLTVHVASVQSEQGCRSSGSVSTDNDGKVSGDSSGGSYSYLVYTVKIEGSPVTYKMGNDYAMRGFHHIENLHIGDYKAHWKNSTILEVLYLNDKDKEKVQHLRVVGEQN